MKITKFYIRKYAALLVGAGMCMATSCSEISFGNEFLGDAPESSGSTLGTMFSSKINAEEVMTRAYQGLPYGLPCTADNRLGGNILEMLTDLGQSYRNNGSDAPFQQYYGGAVNANTISGNAPYLFGGETDWATIKYAWIYIENVDRVPDMTASEKKSKIAEAKMLIALSYFNLMRYIGGVIWLDHSVAVNETMEFPRITFAETVERINALIDEAIPDLPWRWDDNNDGRMSMAGAMALKFKLLQWAASPTFNADTPWHPQADEYTCYGNYDRQRWTAAANAGKAFFDEVNRRGGIALIKAAGNTHDEYRKAYRRAYYNRGGTEILISLRKGYGADICSEYYNSRLYSGPTLNYVDMFPWKDGTDFPADFDWEHPDRAPFFENEGGTLVPTRDPRLYENVACPGDIYFNGLPAPVYIPNDSYRKGETTGFLTMKFILQTAADRSVPVQWPHTRLAEIMLGYAEVLNEVNNGPTAEAYRMVNEVRARVGLSPLPDGMDHDAFFEAVLRERALELGFEEVRWFDLVRNNRRQDFVKPLYGLVTTGDNANHPTKFTFEKFSLPERIWAKNWDAKWYLMPIPQSEINKKYGMTQNPGW